MKKSIFVLIFAVLSSISAKANEGMWIPILLQKYNIEEMQAMGFKLTAEDIYSVNQACMKDAVMLFGTGCTGEIISDEGLLITNHHCGYRAIQSHSSVDHDYLTDGFWAMNRDEELTNDDLSVTFLKQMEDVTAKVLNGVDDEWDLKKQNDFISNNIDSIKKEATKDSHYSAVLKPFFHGNQYFLFINEVYNDIRLVGAPPSAIGKFGGDTDNWMWPRHTGDFSLFRIYADKDNNPASYSADNVPYKPAKHFPISLKGIKENDFTMVFGYPGSTEQYVPSYHLKMITEKVNPALINLRGKKLDIINAYKSDPAVRIKYAAKNASISNSWKRWIGEIKGLEKLNAVEKKQTEEKAFQQWADSYTKEDYKDVLTQYKDLYNTFGTYKLAYNYIIEVVFRNGMEMVSSSANMDKLIKAYKKESPDAQQIEILKAEIKKTYQKLYKDYHEPLDKEMTEMLLTMYKNNIGAEFYPDVYQTIDKKYKNDINKYVNKLFEKSIFSNQEKVFAFIDGFSAKSIATISSDPAYLLYKSFYQVYKKDIYPNYDKVNNELKAVNKKYMAAQMDQKPNAVFYPDANLTLRVSYGQVKAYTPKDGVFYKNHTTLNGIIEKDNPEIYDYRVPEKLKTLYNNKDFGRYEENGTVPVCFVATNHTTGGNSGSPVINANGELIGINFDRAWEGVMSDLMFNPEQCRNISLDMHYVLFLIDKFAGAGYLLNEMTIVE